MAGLRVKRKLGVVLFGVEPPPSFFRQLSLAIGLKRDLGLPGGLDACRGRDDMALFTNFKEAALSAMTLAKVGNPLKGEVLQTSKALCRFSEEDAEWLTHCFLRSFRALDLHRLHHHSDLGSNEVYTYVSGIFDAPESLLENGALQWCHASHWSKNLPVP